MNQFNTSREELKKLGEEFKTQSFTLVDDIYNLSFWLVLKKRIAKKIVWITYKNAIYYCDKTKAKTDWRTWMLRIFFNRIFGYYNKKESKDDFDFESIDRWNAGSKLISNLTENNSNQISDKELLELLKNLPQDLILPLILKDIYNLSYQSIAEFFDVPVTVIANRIYRSRKLFFRLLNAEKNEPDDLTTNETEENEDRYSIEKLRDVALWLDKELKHTDEADLERNLNKEPYLKVEFKIQAFIKAFLSNSISRENAPFSLKEKIKKEAEKRFFIEI
jgi:DNA-directed RNA polymerase specialized sigma24 family protein